MSLVAGKLKYQRGLERLEKTNISKEEIEEPLNYIQNKKGDQEVFYNYHLKIY